MRYTMTYSQSKTHSYITKTVLFSTLAELISATVSYNQYARREKLPLARPARRG